MSTSHASSTNPSKIASPVKLALTAILIALLAIILSGCSLFQGSTDPSVDTEPFKPNDGKNATFEVTLVRVIDGDTIAIKSTGDFPATNTQKTEHKVRLLGIDAPEISNTKTSEPECGADEARDHLKTITKPGATMYLSFDTNSELRDQYGRSLAYVSTAKEDSARPGASDLGLSIITDGYAGLWSPKDDTAPMYHDQYAKALNHASEERAGAWEYCSTLGR